MAADSEAAASEEAAGDVDVRAPGYGLRRAARPPDEGHDAVLVARYIDPPLASRRNE